MFTDLRFVIFFTQTKFEELFFYPLKCVTFGHINLRQSSVSDKIQQNIILELAKIPAMNPCVKRHPGEWRTATTWTFVKRDSVDPGVKQHSGY